MAGAFAFLDPDLARARAREVAAVGPVGDGASPLAGTPTAIKDLNLTAGVPTAFGSPAFAGHIPEVSDAVTLAMEAAGLVSLGKTSTPEFGSPCYTEPEGRPPAVTPWDTTRMAGGSSGGAAAAVAAGLVPVAQGSDGGGSIRIPASCCGLVGLKPTRGPDQRLPDVRRPGRPGHVRLDRADGRRRRSAARRARRAAGERSLLGARALGHVPRGDPREPGRLRIARFVQPVIADVEVSAESRQAYDDASRLLADLGHVIEDVPVPLPPEAVATFETCWAVLTALSVTPLPPEQRAAAAAADPLAGGARRGSQRARVRARDRRGCGSTPPTR